MKKLRLLLLPFAWIYGCITFVRNVLFNRGVLKSYTIPGKSICVGNLSVGGTGKTPHVELIVEHLLKTSNKVAILSRGYGRNTKGLLEVTSQSTASEVGDEPLQYKTKYGSSVDVVVSENRKMGVQHIRNMLQNSGTIVLDDAFQHRAVKSGINIIITQFNDLFVDDFHLPAGDLREWKFGVNRAEAIIVSKCPELNEEEKTAIRNRINFDSARIFFSHIEYDKFKSFEARSTPSVKNILLVTGIGNPTPLLKRLKQTYFVKHLKFKDHHTFSAKDIDEIHEKFDSFASHDKIILTTEKDYVRIKDYDSLKPKLNDWFYQPITTKIDEETKFNQLLDGYVESI